MPATCAPETFWRRGPRCKRASGTDRWAPYGRGCAARGSAAACSPPFLPQVPERVVRAVAGLQGPGVAPVLRCAPTPAGLALQLQRPAVFERVLGAVAAYAAPAAPAAPGPRVVLHCPALRSAPGVLRLSQLRAVLVADHLARALRAHG